MTSQVVPIQGKVAKVISSREVALNIGKTSNVEEGMLFDIVVPGSFEIKDPETDEVLGTIRPKAKARVKVVSVNDKFSLAMTYRHGSPEELRLRGDLMLGEARRVESFKTREALDEAFAERASYVARGDTVIQVIDGK